MRVLVVTGSRTVGAQVGSALAGRPGTELVEVATPQRALRQLRDGGPFDVVVADNDTHPAGGLVMAREAAATRVMGEEVPPVVLLVARHQDAWLARWSGADAWVVKPVDGFDLAEVLEALAAGRRPPALPGVDLAGAPAEVVPGDAGAPAGALHGGAPPAAVAAGAGPGARG